MARELPKPPKTVDLHAEAFLADAEDYDAEDLVLASIDRLRETLDAAIYWEYAEIKYIHGRGKGVLRETVYQELRFYKDNNLISNYHPAYHNEDIVVVHIGL